MAEWKKVKISSFLKERESRIKPAEANKMGLERLNKIDLKIRYYDVILKFLEEVNKKITNRNYSIKNAIDWHKFTAGYS